jgi:hypothetical protein
MEIIIGLLAIAVLAGIWYFNRGTGFDANKDGKVDLKDVKPAVETAVEAVKEAADVNKDGKVGVADAKEAVVKTAKKVAAKPRAPAKPKAPAKSKAPAKKPKMTVVK